MNKSPCIGQLMISVITGIQSCDEVIHGKNKRKIK